MTEPEMPGARAAVLDELYGLNPAAFTAARDARVAEARKAGDREMAKAIKALRRPTVSAWLANLLVRRHGAEIELLLAVGASLRDAQDQLAADDLRRLARQRQQVIAALGSQARALAEAEGSPVSAAAQRELADTLEAAVADGSSGEALRQGRLSGPLRYAGFAPAGSAAGYDVTDVGRTGQLADRQAPGGQAGDPAVDGRQAPDSAADGREAARRARAVRERRAEEEAAAAVSVERARAAARRARQEADEIAATLAGADARLVRRRDDVDDLRARLRAVEAQAEELAGEVEGLQTRSHAATEAARTADAELVTETARLEDLRRRPPDRDG